MRKTSRATLAASIVLLVGAAGPIFAAKTLVLDVKADIPATLDIAPGTLQAAGDGAFYISGTIYEPDSGFDQGVNNIIGKFHCWGWFFNAGVDAVVSQEFDLFGKGKIQVQGVEDQGARAITGGTGRYRNARGQATGADLSNFPEFTITFKLVGAGGNNKKTADDGGGAAPNNKNKKNKKN